MKTAIQELFSKLEIEHPNLFNTNTLEGREFVNLYYKFFELEKERFVALCLFAPCTKFQFTTNVDGANSTKPLLYAGTVYLVTTLN